MEIVELIPHIEALIFASDKPVATQDITDLLNGAFGFMEDKISIVDVSAALDEIILKYNDSIYPFEVLESGGGWQFLTKKDYHKTVAQLNGDKFTKKLSVAAMETLAIVAYKQPVTKSDIEAIRGVSSDYAVQKLLEKDLVVISGRNDTAPGKPLQYATSKTFMDYFGINSADDLPKIKEVLAEQAVEPTIVGGEFVNTTGVMAFENVEIDNNESNTDEGLEVAPESGEEEMLSIAERAALQDTEVELSGDSIIEAEDLEDTKEQTLNENNLEEDNLEEDNFIDITAHESASNGLATADEEQSEEQSEEQKEEEN